MKHNGNMKSIPGINDRWTNALYVGSFALISCSNICSAFLPSCFSRPTLTRRPFEGNKNLRFVVLQRTNKEHGRILLASKYNSHANNSCANIAVPLHRIKATIQSFLSPVMQADVRSSDNTLCTNVKTAGVSDAAVVWKTVLKLHNPIVYFFFFIVAGLRYTWCFKSPIYWFAVGFCIKWYRARYVFKIPVWDRQPNWNNIITSKEQEKDLRAFTCKNCGSTLFIAKTREFFFEGDTGFGGLGCFSCGAKGKDNFVMDRDRIVEDVGDMDDYFEYERPLDFVSRAERRSLLKQAAGNESLANQILVNRTFSASSSMSTAPPAPEIVNEVEVTITHAEEPNGQRKFTPSNTSETEEGAVKSTKISKKGKKPKRAVSKPATMNENNMDDLDALDMDSF